MMKINLNNMNGIHFKNHVAYRFLKDYFLWLEIMAMHSKTASELFEHVKTCIRLNLPSDILDATLNKMSEEDHSMWHSLSREGNKNYLITKTVTDKLHMLKVNPDKLDWSVFDKIPDGKYTFIHSANELLRLNVTENVLHFTVLGYDEVRPKDNYAHLYSHMFFVDKRTYTPCEHMVNHKPVIELLQPIYRLLCFLYLSETTEEVLKPGASKGTKKEGKIINTLGEDITIVNSKWNVTAIRTEQFGVSGHFAIRWAGAGRTERKLVWIDPFIKNGYIRKAKSETIKQ